VLQKFRAAPVWEPLSHAGSSTVSARALQRQLRA
jgi:hypothetical protein